MHKGYYYKMILTFVLLTSAGGAYSLQRVSCAKPELCDPEFRGGFRLQHPNVDKLREDIDKNEHDVSGKILPPYQSSKGEYFWSLGEHWSAHSLLSDSTIKDDERVIEFSNIKDANSITSSIVNKVEMLDGLSCKEVGCYQSLRVLQTPSKSIIINNDPELFRSFGDITIAFNTWSEYFSGDDFINNPEVNPGLIKALKYNKDDPAELKDIMEPLLIRDEMGQSRKIKGTGSCSVRDIPPIKYCKWIHLGLSQRFRNIEGLGLSLQKGPVSLALDYRVLNANDHPVNKYLYNAGLTKYFFHFNLRINLVRKRDKPIEYFNRRNDKDVVKSHDSVKVMIPLYEAFDFCLNKDGKNSNYCQQVGLKKVQTQTHDHSKFRPKPDLGTLSFMYHFGDIELFGENLDKVLMDRANEQWVHLEIDNLNLHMKEKLIKTMKGCEKKHKEWGIPIESCDVESTDINDYTIDAFNFGWEVAGVWTGVMQLRNLSFRVK